MELLYIYIDKYRTFEKQKISFSNKFVVNYNEDGCTLSIKENEDYFDLYPNNIINISGILGKNASGKSSLLSLIGTKIDERHRAQEIFAGEEKNPHEKFDIFLPKKSSGLDNIQYSSSYFLLYYIGKDSEGLPIFVLKLTRLESI